MSSLSRHDRRRLRTRGELVEATAQLLVECGYEDLTVLMITERADLARATFYVHFKDKEEAVWAVLADRVSALAQPEQDEGQQDEFTIRHRKWTRMFEFADEHRGLFTVVLSERGHIRLREALRRFMVQAITHDMTSGRLSQTANVPLDFEANFYAGAVLELLSWWLRDPNPAPVEEMTRHLGEMVFRTQAGTTGMA